VPGKAVLLDGSQEDGNTGERIRAALTAQPQAQGWDVEHIVLREKKIGPCAGDFFCWVRSPGVCNVDDDNRDIAEALVASDLMVYLTPVRFGGYSSALKSMVDHQVQNVSPSQLYLLPERGSAIVLLSNASGYEQVSQVHKMATGVLTLLYDKPSPGPVSLPIGTRLQYWALLLTPFLLIAGIVLVWRNRERGGTWLIILTVILNLAVVFVLFRLALNRITLPSMLVFHPELGYALIAIATIGIGWSVFYTAMSLRARRSK